MLLNNQTNAQTSIEGWKKALQNAKHDTTRIKCYNEIAFLFQFVDTDSCRKYLDKTVELCKENPLYEGNLRNYMIWFHYYFRQDDNANSRIYLQKMYDLASTLHNEAYVVKSKFNMATIKEHEGKLSSSIKQILEIEPIVAKQPIGKRYINLSVLYHSLAIQFRNFNTNKSNEYLNKILPAAENATDSILYYRTFLSLSQQSPIEIKLKHTQEGLRLAKKTKDTYMEAFFYMSYNSLLVEQKQFTKALVYIQKGLELSEKNGFTAYKMHSLYMLGVTYAHIGKYKQAKALFDKVIPYYRTDSTSMNDMPDVFKDISNFYSKHGEYEKAYQLFVEAATIQEKMVGLEKQKIVAELNAQYELNEKQAQISAQELENKLQQERLSLVEKQKYFFMSLMGIFLLLFAWALYNFRRKTKLSRALAAEKATVQLQAQELLKTNQTKDKLFAMIGHDLRSPIAALKDSLVIWKNIEVQNPQTPVGKHFSKVYSDLENVQFVLNNLLSWASNQINALHPNKRLFSLNYLIESVVKQCSSAAIAKNIRIIRHLNDALVEVDEQQLVVVVRNVLSNAIKFTPESGFIKVSTHNLNTEIELAIEDTGIGISAEQLLEVFNYPTPRKGTNGEKGTGLGLSLSKELVEKNGGKISISSILHQGTKVTIRIPLKAGITVE